MAGVCVYGEGGLGLINPKRFSVAGLERGWLGRALKHRGGGWDHSVWVIQTMDLGIRWLGSNSSPATY